MDMIWGVTPLAIAHKLTPSSKTVLGEKHRQQTTSATKRVVIFYLSDLTMNCSIVAAMDFLLTSENTAFKDSKADKNHLNFPA